MQVKTKNSNNFVTVTEKSISGVKAIDRNGVVTVFFNLTINGVTIYGCRVVTPKNGSDDFIAFPSHKDANGKYWNYAYVKLSDTDTKEILAEVEKEVNK